MAFDVVAVGEAKIDEFLTIETAADTWRFDEKVRQLCFAQGSKIEVDKCEICLGGDAANVSVGLSRLGLSVSLFAEMGDDEFSLRIRNTFAKENVDRSNIIQTKNAASSFSVIFSTKGDRVIFSEHVVRAHNFVFDHLEKPKLLYLTSLGKEWESAYKNAAEFVKKNGVALAFNPGTRQLREGKSIVSDVLKNTALLFVNKEEGKTLASSNQDSASSSMEDLLKALQKLGPKIVVVTDGNNGSYAMDEKGSFFTEPVFPGEVVERTGAGDAYTSGFLAAHLSGLSVQDCMQWGAKNAASVVGKVGAEAGLLTKEQIAEQ